MRSIVVTLILVIGFALIWAGFQLDQNRINNSPPTCTNTTIDAYYKCQPTTPIMLRR